MSFHDDVASHLRFGTEAVEVVLDGTGLSILELLSWGTVEANGWKGWTGGGKLVLRSLWVNKIIDSRVNLVHDIFHGLSKFSFGALFIKVSLHDSVAYCSSSVLSWSSSVKSTNFTWSSSVKSSNLTLSGDTCY